MYTNGLVIQKYIDNPYKGIDGSRFSENTGENWYFNDDKELSAVFEPYYDENINFTYYDLENHTHVAACTEMSYIQKYVEESEKRGIRFRILLVESDIPEPAAEFPKLKTNFLGYDYAYIRGDNYSAVYNEIPFVFPQFKLNENGLFQTEEELREYLAAREKFKSANPPYTLEEGDFAVLRLSEVEW